MSHSDEKKSETSVQAHEATNDIYSIDDTPGLDRVYHAKARLLNSAIQEIGMGKYQVRPRLCSPRDSRQSIDDSGGSSSSPVSDGSQITCGLQVRDIPTTNERADPSQIVTGLILGPVVYEFSFEGPFLKLGQASTTSIGSLHTHADLSFELNAMRFPRTLPIT